VGCQPTLLSFIFPISDKERYIRRLKTAEMKFMRRKAGNNLLDRKRNQDNLEELKVDPVRNKLAQYKQKMVKLYQHNGRH
jgi:hypothetical protein